jgi:hypothetical protein
MTLQVRRGLSADRTTVTPLSGEFLYTTDTKLVYIGDGTTAGGNSVGGGGGGSGTVTSVSVVSANGFAGTVATSTTTPAITVSTSITGVLKGNGTAISAATAGTDYQAPITLTTTGTSGASTFVGNTLNIPQYSGGGGSGTVTSVAATVPSFLSVAGSPITTSGTLAISYSGTALPVANGGTGVTASSGANSVVLRDANQNIAANSFNDSYSNIAASGTGITLTVSSARRYTITGSGGQVFTLPDATTLTNGSIFEFDNNQSSGAITVNNNSSTLIVSVPSGAIVRIDLLSNASAAGSWDKHSLTPSNVSWSTNTLDYPGSITSATWNGVAVAINRGGTGQTTQAAAITALAGTQASGQYLRSDGTNTLLSAIQAADVPTLNQNTTGTAANVTGTVAIANGGSGQTTAQLAMNAFAGAVTSGSYLRGNGTNVVMATIQAGDVPTLNQNTTGNAATATSATTATNLAGGVNLQIPYNTGSGTTSFIAAPIVSSTYLQYNGTGFSWASASGLGTVTSVAASVPSFLSISGSPITTAGTLAISYSGTALPIANGGTALTTTPTNGQLLIGNGTNYTLSTLTAGSNITITNTSGAITIASTGGGSGITTGKSIAMAMIFGF